MSDEPEVLRLLQRWHAGDQEALAALLAAHLPWLHEQVRNRMGPAMRAQIESDDLVQQAFVDFLRSGPKFLVRDPEHFRALMLRIVENALRQQHRNAHRMKRDVARMQTLPSGSVLDLHCSGTHPSAAASRDEHRAWVQLALELLPEDQRELIRLRDWEGLAFGAIAERLGVREDAARMRYRRALRELALMLLQLRSKGAAGLPRP